MVIEDLLLQAEQLQSKVYVDYVSNSNVIGVRQSWDEEGVLPPQINADISEIYKRLEEASIINSKKKPMCQNSFVAIDASFIISYYNTLAYDLLSYFRCVDNLSTIKKIVTYHLRYSLLHTLARKHKCSIKKVLEMYSKEIKAGEKRGKVISFINSVAVTNLKKKFLFKDLRAPYSNLTRLYINLQRAAISGIKCMVKNCTEIDNMGVYKVRKLFRTINGAGKIVIRESAKKFFSQFAPESVLKKKQITLCSKHHTD